MLVAILWGSCNRFRKYVEVQNTNVGIGSQVLDTGIQVFLELNYK